MSYQAMAWATAQRTGSPTRKAVLLALANRLNHDTGLCCPKIATISDETELGERAIRDALKALEDGGLIARTRTRGDAGQLRGYVYSFPLMEPGSTFKASPAASAAALRPARDAGLNQEVEPGSKPSPAAPSKEDRDRIWDALVDVFGTPTTTSARNRFGKTVRELLTDDSMTPAQVAVAVPMRAARMREAWPGITLTLEALVKHWSAFATRDVRPEPQRVEADLEDDGTGRRTF